MSPRLAGAALALIAAALLAMSLVTSAWWAGHPEVGGHTIDAKTVHIGLHGAEGCNTGGDQTCTSLDMPGAFTATGYAAAGASGLLAIGAVLLAIATLRMTDGRKTLATIVFVLTAVAVLVAIALLVQGPKVKASQHVAIPMGYGIGLFAGGTIAAVLGAVLARRPAPKIELRPSRAAVAPAAGGQQPVDVLALLKDDAVRPTAPVSTPLPGPAGPLGASQSQPLFNAAPQLRPLYDAAPNVGGTSGYVPGAAPQLPTTAPTPIPRASVSAIAGIPTPAPIPAAEPPRPVTTQGAAAMPLAGPRPKPPSFAPPSPPRTNPPSIPPPAPRTSPASVPPPPRMTPPSVPPPVAGTHPPTLRGRPGTVPPPPGAIAARLKASSVPPPVRPASVALPAPTTPKTLAGTPAPPIVAAKLPVRAETDPSELAETVDRDAAAAAADVGDATDASVAPAPGAEAEDTGVSAPLDTEEAPAVRPESEGDFAETNAVPKQEPGELAREAQAEEPKIPITTAPSTLPPPKEKQAAASGPSPACPQCEAPMAWVEEHLRFYCKSCRMYF